MWRKKGLLFDIAQFKDQGLLSHASIPFAFHLSDDQYRIYFSSRDEAGRSQPFYIDVLVQGDSITMQGEVVGPIFERGPLGSFDDNGIMPSSVVRHGEEVWMYYIGWNPQVTVSYRLSIGLAISKDGGKTFHRSSDGPLLDRSYHEPFFNTAPFVLQDHDLWRMFYVSCTGWIDHLGRKEPLYLVRQSTSTDGIHWTKPGVIVVDYSAGVESIGRPCVVKHDGRYEIYFSHRMARDYREDQAMSYKIGCANSMDAGEWTDFSFDIFNSIPQDWDNHMYEYCHVFIHGGKKFMLYNGNGFGQQGFGYAVKDLI
ncbi:MAG: hypothetical protein FJX95_00415 [Bacteroidetes bacterium]|nr:hypothetical protein [Bacteroidota bacterium]